MFNQLFLDTNKQLFWMTIVEQLSIGRVWQQEEQRSGERVMAPERKRSCTAFPTSYDLHRKAIP
uniref:Uncharacterized protein n=1 Tax=Heterorhabditis bacteriophora TaxID=37862 RepID=A0A1I7XVE1_HETBA